MKAFVPIASRIFGSRTIGIKRKCSLAWSLVLSRLLFNVHTWSSFKGRHRCIISCAYMKVWRRISGHLRKPGNRVPDLAVRTLLDVPSVDCVVRRHRLSYFSRLATETLPALNALLQFVSPKGQRLPWVDLILNDLVMLKLCSGRRLEAMPDPRVDLSKWWSLAGSFPLEWKELVSSYHSVYDDDQFWSSISVPSAPETLVCPAVPATTGANTAAHASPAYACQLCSGKAFMTSKALAQHARIKHKMRTPVDQFVPATATCMVCGTIFASRLLLVSHLSDNRVRSKVRGQPCGQVFLSRNPQPVDAQELQRIHDSERQIRRDAASRGHTHQIALVPAFNPRRSVLKGIKADLLARVVVGGARRRLNKKTSPILGSLRIKVAEPMSAPLQPPSKRQRITAKTPAHLLPAYH